MKKIIVVLLLCALILSCLASCKGRGRNPDTPEEPPVTQGVKYNSYNGNPLRSITESEKENALISELTNYLLSLKWSSGDLIYVVGTSLASQITNMHLGAAPYLVSVDPADYYYMCAYYSESESDASDNDIYLDGDIPSSDDNSKLGYDYGIATAYQYPVYNYTWVRFENPTDITEYYDGRPLVEAFQINGSFFVSNIYSEDTTVPNFEYYNSYKTEFVEGYNVNGIQAVSGTFIYLYYYSTSVIFYSGKGNKIPCVEIDGEYFIRVNIDGKNEEALMEELGYWYEELSAIMDTESYTEITQGGIEIGYGIIGVREFADVVFNNFDVEYPDINYAIPEVDDYIISEVDPTQESIEG